MIAQHPPSTSVEHSLSVRNKVSGIASFIAEASQRFGVPEAWIYGVIDVESRRNPGAVSPKGALGLMQLMPATWRHLRLQLALGADPFDPHDNIIAGTAYLRFLFDRYGASGFLAAYNAGPGRYENALSNGKPLPAETIVYVAALTQRMQLDSSQAIPLKVSKKPAPWSNSPLFAGSAGAFDSATDTTQRPVKAEVFVPVSGPSDRPQTPPPSP